MLLQLRHMKPVGPQRQNSWQSRMGQDRTKLLRALAIDRGEDRPMPVARAWPARSLLGLAALIIALLAAAWVFVPQLRLAERAAEPASAPAEGARSAQKAGLPSPTEPQVKAGLTASGYVVARRKATVAAEVTGKVVELLVEEGMVVAAGQVVARLDSLLAETDLTLAQSRAAAAEAAAAAVAADLADAERILNRIRSLSQKSIASEADLTKAEARAGILRAQLSQAQAQLQTARLDVQRNATVLDKHNIRAPFGGIVVERSAQPGEMISPISAGGGFTRTGICTIVDMDSIEIEVDVNEAFIGRVRTGGAISAVLDAYPDWTIPAAVIALVPTANREKATVKVRIALKQKDPRVLPDMAVKVKFQEEENAAAAPTAEAVSAAK
jgi:HlyD family secretion protein